MTLEVIGELILGLTPAESARIFPDLYLPIVTEANIRVWHPYRGYLPTPAARRYTATVQKLNDFVSDFIRRRWARRCQVCVCVVVQGRGGAADAAAAGPPGAASPRRART